MRLVNIAYVEEGEVLARPLISPNGKILLQSGVRLTRNYIEKLQQLGIDTMFIEDDTFDDVEIHTTVSTQTREVAYAALQNLSKNLNGNNMSNLNLDEVERAVQNIIEDLLCSHDLVFNVHEIQGYDDYTFQHSVNTTIIALIMAISMGWPQNRLLELGMGVLMHDVGKIKVPPEILNKKGPLTEGEFAEIKKHAEYGFEILRQCRDVNLLSAHVALQHQERWDGSGYPRGLKGTEIHEYGRLAAVADVYEAYEYVVANSGKLFEPKIVKDTFTKCITPYPNGSGIRLSNGQRGNVVKQNPCFPTRPYVRITHDGDKPLPFPLDYDLADNPSLVIIAIENK